MSVDLKAKTASILRKVALPCSSAAYHVLAVEGILGSRSFEPLGIVGGRDGALRTVALMDGAGRKEEEDADVKDMTTTSSMNAGGGVITSLAKWMPKRFEEESGAKGEEESGILVASGFKSAPITVWRLADGVGGAPF